MFQSLNPNQNVPALLRLRFYHLYWDVIWFGLLAGSSLSFIAVYAARLGASALQIGLITAGPAIINLFFTMPAGRWLHHQPIGKAIFTTIVLNRLPYLLWMILPSLLPTQAQIWAYILLLALMTLPGTAIAVGFNALFAEAVPLEWRAHMVGLRNALMAISTVVSSLLCGVLLDFAPYPLNYQIVFALGTLGAGLSAYHIWFLRDVVAAVDQNVRPIDEADAKQPVNRQQRGNLAQWLITEGKKLLRVDILRSGYGYVVAALFVFHFAQFLPIALFPLRWVALHFSDFSISFGMALLQAAVAIGSLYFTRMTQWLGYHRSIVYGALGMSLYPLMTAYMTDLPVFALTSFLGGIAWSMVVGSIGNHLLEKMPTEDRPAYLAWYNLALNAGILLGSLCGPLLSDVWGLTTALLVSFVVRALAAYCVWVAR